MTGPPAPAAVGPGARAGGAGSGRAALGVLTGLNVLNYADRYVGAAGLPLLLGSLALSDAEGGLLQSIFILTYALVSPVAGWVGDRRARLPLAAAGVLLWSLATVGSGLAPSYAWLLLARAVIGVGEASYAVVTPSLLSDLYPAERRGRALALFYAAIPVGTALGYGIGGTLGGRFGWRAAFLVAGLPGALLGLSLLLLREPPRGSFDPASAHTPLGLAASARALLARPSFAANAAAQVIYTFAMGGLATWMPTYFLRERGIPLGRAAATFGSLLFVAGLAGTLLGGQLGDRLARRVRGAQFAISGWGLLGSLGFTLLAVLSPSAAVFWPALFVTLFLLFVNVGPLNAAMANVLPPDLRGRGFALTTMGTHLLGDAASPWLIGLVSDRVGLQAPVLAAGILLAASGLVLLAARGSLERDLAR